MKEATASGNELDNKTWSGIIVLTLGFLAGIILMPWWFFAIALGSSLVLLGLLLTSPRWPHRVIRTLVRPVPIPRWCYLSTVLVGVSLLALTRAELLFLNDVPWVVLTGVGIGGLVGVIDPTARLRSVDRIPGWLFVLAGVISIAPLSVFLGYLSPLSVIFLGAVVLFGLLIWVILPIAIYQYRTETPQIASAPYPSVSVIIPAYNEAGFIGRCIESVLQTTYPEKQLEIIVVDDGSTDDTVTEAEQYSSDGVTILRRTNGGKHAALNTGLVVATGEILVCVDGDSLLAPDAIDVLVGQFQEDESVGGVAGTVYVENDNRHITKLQALEYAFGIQTFRRVYSLFGVVPLLPGCLAAFRREALDGVWGFDPDTRTEDFDATLKILKNGWLTRHSPAVVYTTVPPNWHSLWKQRDRWFGGNIETIWKHRNVGLTPEYGYLHALVLPVRLISMFFVPLASFIIAVAVIWALLFGPTVYVLTVAGFFLVLTVLLLWVTLRMDGNTGSVLRYSPFFFVGYKHFLDGKLAISTWNVLLGKDREW